MIATYTTKSRFVNIRFFRTCTLICAKKLIMFVRFSVIIVGKTISSFVYLCASHEKEKKREMVGFFEIFPTQ